MTDNSSAQDIDYAEECETIRVAMEMTRCSLRYRLNDTEWLFSFLELSDLFLQAIRSGDFNHPIEYLQKLPAHYLNLGSKENAKNTSYRTIDCLETRRADINLAVELANAALVYRDGDRESLFSFLSLMGLSLQATRGASLSPAIEFLKTMPLDRLRVERAKKAIGLSLDESHPMAIRKGKTS